MTPLRQRFLDDLQLRNYSPRTIEAYLAAVVRFSKHFQRSPDLLGPEHVRDFQIHLIARRVSWSLFN
jgi:integrase/recombinase XerD